MEYKKIKFNVRYYLPYIPQRCRKVRYEEIHEDLEFKVRSITSDDAPIAFVLHDFHNVHEGTAIMRCYKKRLYTRYMVRGRFLQGHSDKDGNLYPQGFDYLHRLVHPSLTWEREECNKKYAVTAYKDELDRYILIDGEIWKRRGEPRYEVNTFGLGHNHGGTGLFVATSYNPNIPKTRYFSALDWQKAIDTANDVARRRGDTKDVGKFQKMIDVVMPEMVKCKPMKEHGEGDKFINQLNAITENSASATDAGLLCMLLAVV